MLKIFQRLRTWIFLSLICLTLTWSFPAQADTKVNSQLEQQVLQILRQNPEVIIESIQTYQQQQQQKVQKSRQEFIQALQTNPKEIIGNSPTTGSTNLKTVLIEFSDFQCPYCAEAHKALKDLLAKYPNQFTLVYKHFPITQIHAEALPAAKAAWAAYQQGKFWEFHDALFTNQKQLGETLYLDTAKKLQLDLGKFNRDRNLATNAINTDLEIVNKLGLGGTPSFVITSPKFSGPIQLTDIEGVLAGNNSSTK
ncbi:DSBA oxidoreductase [Richelia sinica FACHB-800]|uniref:DSBA oxidoreductase n=1 Tax=Richelia sinica FACHB-800 TaxID=1357546 RepID=A0A975TA12_9NOST|nr:DsbA family protein [Richelia sinica]MBD2667099.1 DsbA family protein [Richelia sinica FACHB-800]QXE24859.1 DSBA oxidoreductase [Richelia sinica FACHB-800]